MHLLVEDLLPTGLYDYSWIFPDMADLSDRIRADSLQNLALFYYNIREFDIGL